jgi:hypothetical protein
MSEFRILRSENLRTHACYVANSPTPDWIFTIGDTGRTKPGVTSVVSVTMMSMLAVRGQTTIQDS